MRNSMHRTSILAALVCAAVAASARADAPATAPANTPADTTKVVAPAGSTPVATAPVESDAAAATTTANGKVVLRENLYYYDAFNRRDPFRSLVDGAFNRNDKMDLVNLSAVQLVGVVRGEVDRFALLEDTSGYSYILRVGDRVHNGTVVSIGEDELVARVTNFGQTTTVRLHLVGR